MNQQKVTRLSLDLLLVVCSAIWLAINHGGSQPTALTSLDLMRLRLVSDVAGNVDSQLSKEALFVSRLNMPPSINSDPVAKMLFDNLVLEPIGAGWMLREARKIPILIQSKSNIKPGAVGVDNNGVTHFGLTWLK